MGRECWWRKIRGGEKSAGRLDLEPPRVTSDKTTGIIYQRIAVILPQVPRAIEPAPPVLRQTTQRSVGPVAV